MLNERLLACAKSFFYDQRLAWHQSNLRYFEGCNRILDIGCGKGLFSELAPDRIISLDVSRALLAVHKRNGSKVIGQAFELPFRYESFDGVYCADVIEHFMPLEARGILEESARVLKPAGKLVIATPYPSKEFWCDPTHVRPYPPEALLSYCIPDAEKGKGNNPTLPSISMGMKFVALKERRRPIATLPFTLFFSDDRRKISKLLHPRSLAYMLTNVLARIGIRHPVPEGYMLVLEKQFSLARGAGRVLPAYRHGRN